MANEKTPNYHWDIPNPYGLQIVEMMKVASTFGAIDSRFKAFEDAYLSHKHSFADITDRPTTLNGYGITDAITTDQVKSEIEASQTAQQSVIDQSIQSLANSTADALALRVRADAAQAFTLAQKSRARQNIDALGTIDRGVPNGVATLDAGGKIPSSQLPPVAISETFVVNSQASMLALVAERGDIAVRPDLNKTFILRLEPATVLANWQEILTPADGVLSVNGLTGPVINLEPAHLNLGNVANKTEAQMVDTGAIADKINALQGQINNRVIGDSAITVGFSNGYLNLPYLRRDNDNFSFLATQDQLNEKVSATAGGVLPVGSHALCFLQASSGDVGNGGTCAGSRLRVIRFSCDVSGNSPSIVVNGSQQTGTWQNISGYTIVGSSSGTVVRVAYFARIS